jgi:hypothetical protein
VTRREALRFTALVEQEVQPGGDLPAVRDTDAVAAFDAWLRAAPRSHAWLLRAALAIHPHVAALDDLLRRVATHCYYGDPAVMRRLGYDADAVVARAAELRAAEGRP